MEKEIREEAGIRFTQGLTGNDQHFGFCFQCNGKPISLCSFPALTQPQQASTDHFSFLCNQVITYPCPFICRQSIFNGFLLNSNASVLLPQLCLKDKNCIIFPSACPGLGTYMVLNKSFWKVIMMM